MIRHVYLKYTLKDRKVVIGIDRVSGSTIALWVNGIDFIDDGQVEHDITNELRESGIDVHSDYIEESLRLDRLADQSVGRKRA